MTNGDTECPPGNLCETVNPPTLAGPRPHKGSFVAMAVKVEEKPNEVDAES